MEYFILAIGGGVVLVALAVLGLRRWRESARRHSEASRQGWRQLRGSRDLPDWLLACSVSQLGHSRRLEAVLEADGPTFVFEYVFETGFEHRRFRHHWIGAARPSGHARGRAVVAGTAWARAIGTPPGHRAIGLGETAVLTAIVEDPAEWTADRSGALRDWLARQSPDHVWEIVPGYVVGYAPGVLTDAVAAQITAAAGELAEAVKATDIAVSAASSSSSSRADRPGLVGQPA